MSKKVLAFDFGGSSGRALLGQLDGEKLNYKEIHRFANSPKQIGTSFCWDFDDLFDNVLKGIEIASAEGFDAIGIDTWGVDYGIIDKEGNLLKAPTHYRDERTVGVPEKVDMIIQRPQLYKATGIQPMRINTIYQLFDEYTGNDAIAAKTEKVLFMPDLFAYMLCGEMFAEPSIASTSALFDGERCEWDFDLIDKLGIPKHIFPKILKSGQSYGLLKDEIAKKYNIAKVPIIAVPAHDTASAILSMPDCEDDCIYISCGTWSLMGIKADKIVTNDTGFTNEYGFSYITYLKNIMGLWLMQETNRTLKAQGIDSSFKILDEYMMETTSLGVVVDPNAPEFELPCDMPKAIKEYCKKTGQAVPNDIGQVVHCIYESLAICYKYTLEKLQNLTGKKYRKICIIGGGSKADVLCQMTADFTGKEVSAGPSEATAIGNMLAQLYGLGEITSEKQMNKIILNTEKIINFSPQKTVDCEAMYNKFLQLVGEGL